MNLTRTTLTLLIALAFTHAKAQFKGQATYKTAASMTVDMNGDMPGVDVAAIQKQISQQMQREYTLTFNTDESSYKRVEELDKTGSVASGGVQIRMTGGDGLLYRNTKTNEFREFEDLFGKKFLVVDEPERLEWKIANELKQIGQYECQKATFQSTQRRMTMNAEDGEDGELVEEVDTVDVIAWFAPSLAVSHGPDEYWGLPGLILEVQNGNFKILCTKVVINSDDIGEIEIPKKGKKISQADFEALQEEKLQEMMNQYQGEGNRTIIRIGG